MIVEDDPAPARTRRPLDVARLLSALLLPLVIVGLATAGTRTFSGLSADLDALGGYLPPLAIGALAVGSAFVGLLLLPGLLFLLLVRRRFRAGIELAASVVLAILFSYAATEVVLELAPDRVIAAFTPAGLSSPGVNPVPGSIAALTAAITVAGRAFPGAGLAASLAIGGTVAAGLLDGTTTVPGVALAAGLGRAASLLVRLVSGVRTRRPGGEQLVALLQAHGMQPLEVRALPGSDPFRYDVRTTLGRLDVSVLDRHRQGADLLGQGLRKLRIREEVVPREALTFAGAVDRRVLITHAATSAGVRTPRLVLAVAAEPDAAVIALEHVDGRPLGTLRGDEVSDAALDDVWDQLGRMRAAGLAHHSLSGSSILVDAADRVWIVNPSGGEVAAPAFALRADLAQLLVALALVIGPDRAVDSAVRDLGREAVGDVVPLLQPVAMPRRTRQDLRDRREVLSAVRSRVVEQAEPEAVQPAALERFKPRTLLTGLAVALAVYLVTTQLASVDLTTIIDDADWTWMLVALLATVVSYVGATFALLGFVAEKVPFWRAFWTQVALSFVRLVAPSAIGNTAVNLRMLTRVGVSVPAATASVAASQVAAVLITVPLLLVLGLYTGRAATAGLAPSLTALAIVGIALFLAVLLIFLTPLRTRARTIWQAFTERGLPRLLDVLQNPVKLAQGVGGNLVLTLAYTAALDACVRAMGGEASFAALALVFLTGNTVGTAIPTPGGLGAVEAALAFGLTAVGIATSVAVPAVLLFRIATFWLPLLPGWLSWTRLQRIGAV